MGCGVCGCVVGGYVVGGCEGRCDVCHSGCVVLGGLDVESCVCGVGVWIAFGVCVGGLTVVRAGVVMWWQKVSGDVLMWAWDLLVAGSIGTVSMMMGRY